MSWLLTKKIHRTFSYLLNFQMIVVYRIHQLCYNLLYFMKKRRFIKINYNNTLKCIDLFNSKE